MAIKFVQVEIVLVETVLVGDPLYCRVTVEFLNSKWHGDVAYCLKNYDKQKIAMWLYSEKFQVN